MRKYAWLKEPFQKDEQTAVSKVMLYEAEEGFYLFLYSSPDALMSCGDLCYDSLEDLYEDWNRRIDHNGWNEMDDPLPGTQHDAFLPMRVKGRESGEPQWGEYEVLFNGEWIEYQPE